MYWILPTVPTIDTTGFSQPTPTTTPVFRSSTECPIPNEWLIGAALVGLALGYVMWGRS